LLIFVVLATLWKSMYVIRSGLLFHLNEALVLNAFHNSNPNISKLGVFNREIKLLHKFIIYLFIVKFGIFVCLYLYIQGPWWSELMPSFMAYCLPLLVKLALSVES
ncbi:hypothetical protein L9F63_021585, partial [Diploptera punctata]